MPALRPRSLPRTTALIGALVVGAALVAGCPARVEPGQRKAQRQVSEDDPRVVRSSGDLYAVDSPGLPDPDPLEDGTSSAEDAVLVGVGKPDETNGVCRLFAPEFKKPECCARETGFDASKTAELCGHEHFLGEHFRGDCGYYFLPKPASPHTWIRVGFTAGETAKAAADDRDEFIRRRFRDPDFGSKPVPGVPGAYWAGRDGVKWAHVPGWKNVRRVTWDEQFCSEEAMAKVIAELAAAAEPEEGADRNALVPTARPK